MDEKTIFTDGDFGNDDMFYLQAEYFLTNFDKIDSTYLPIAQASLEIVDAAKKSMIHNSEICMNEYKEGMVSENISL